MKLWNVPSDCQLYMFNSTFTLQELFHLRTLSRHFQSLIESRYCIGRRKSLKLFWRFEEVQRYSFELVEYGLEDWKELNFAEVGSLYEDVLVLNARCLAPIATLCHLLTRLLPNVQHLLIHFAQFYYYPNYVELAEQLFNSEWSGQLVGLTLLGAFRHTRWTRGCDEHELLQENNVARLAFVRAINQLGALKYFNMCSENLFDNRWSVSKRYEATEVLLPVQLDRVLPQLERLYLCYANANAPEQIIRHLGRQCTSLRLSSMGSQMVTTHHPLPQDELCSALLVSPLGGNMHQLTDLMVDLNKQNSNLIRTITGQGMFTHIRSLTLSCDSIDPQQPLCLVMVLKQVAKLSHLTSLKLIEFNFDQLNCVNYRTLPFPVLRQINTLTINRLVAPNLPYLDMTFDLLYRIFPSVKHMTLVLYVPVLTEFTSFAPIDEHHQYFTQFTELIHFRLITLGHLIANFVLPGMLSDHLRDRFIQENPDLWEQCATVEAGRYNYSSTMQQWTRAKACSSWDKADGHCVFCGATNIPKLRDTPLFKYIQSFAVRNQ